MRLVLGGVAQGKRNYVKIAYHISCLLYTSDAADE